MYKLDPRLFNINFVCDYISEECIIYYSLAFYMIVHEFNFRKAPKIYILNI